MDIKKLRQRVVDRTPPGRSWYAISNKTGPTATLRIYDEIWYFGVNADDFAKDLDEITAPEIEVQINSPGGDVFDGIAIYNALRSHQSRIITRVDGIAASIASVIAQAGDQRIMMSGSQMMIHEAWGLVIGPARDMREYADFLDKQTDVIAGIYAEASDEDAEHFRSLMDLETWFTADEAVEAGLADEVVVPERRDADNRDNKTLKDELSDAMGVVSAVIESAERVDALRAEAGKSLSNVNQESLDELNGYVSRLVALLNETEEQHAHGDTEALQQEYARFVALTQGASA